MPRIIPLAISLALSLTISTTALAAPFLVRNIGEGFDNASGSRPTGVFEAGDFVFFFATDDLHGRELWRTDGTEAGTTIVKDLVPGETGIALDYSRQLEDNRLIFTDGRQIWISDGTSDGTYELTSETLIVPLVFVRGYDPSRQQLFFEARSTELGKTIWVTDLTPGSVRPVFDLAALSPYETLIYNGAFHSGGFAFGSYTAGEFSLWNTDGTEAGTTRLHTFLELGPLKHELDGRLYFFAAEDASGLDLWSTDGTPEGTRRAVDLVPGPERIQIHRGLSAWRNTLYFFADDGVLGVQLWRSDGTPSGTYPIKAVAPRGPFREHNDALYFGGNDGLHGFEPWRTDGTPEGTAIVADICPGPCDSEPRIYANGDDQPILLDAEDGTHGRELWATDGDAASTHLVADLCPGTCDSDPFRVGPFDGELLIVASPTEPSSAAFWLTDGTAAGTRQVIFPPELHVPRRVVKVSNDLIFFSADDGIHGMELWRSDGTTEGTRLVSDIRRDGDDGAHPTNLITIGNRLAFTTRENPPRYPESLWWTDGTEDGTERVLEVVDGPSFPRFQPSHMAAAGDKLFFIPREDGPERLWVSAGTPFSTRPLVELPGYTPPLSNNVLGDRLFFVSDSKLWVSNGTIAGTLPLALGHDLSVGSMAVFGDTLFLSASSPDTGHELWKTDGTPAGTKLVRDIVPGVDGSAPQSLTPLNGALYFFAYSAPLEAKRLWKTDGTAAGTRTITPSAVTPDTRVGTVVTRNRIFFYTPNIPFSRGPAIWSTDGTAAGTVRLIELEGTLIQLVAAGDRVFFVETDAAHGRELWTSDGTPEGTGLVKDIAPGPEDGLARFELLTSVGDLVVFKADDNEAGRELWASDGTPEGTVRLDLEPGPGSSSPDSFTVAGNLLYFAATIGDYGRELWALPLAELPSAATASARLGPAGRFEVQVAWRDPTGGRGAGTGRAAWLGEDTGTFWFFDPANVELIVKVLDGRAFNGNHWVFYGGLSNLEYTITVTDRVTGAQKSYFNPAGSFASVGDTQAFPTGPAPTPAPPSTATPAPSSATKMGSCAADPAAHCLRDRFRVTVAWSDPILGNGSGQTVPLSTDTGAFWFFDDDNVELVVKVLDGRPFNGRFWVFYASLSNVQYTLTVTDTETGAVRTYQNPAGRFASTGDTAAF